MSCKNKIQKKNMKRARDVYTQLIEVLPSAEEVDQCLYFDIGKVPVPKAAHRIVEEELQTLINTEVFPWYTSQGPNPFRHILQDMAVCEIDIQTRFYVPTWILCCCVLAQKLRDETDYAVTVGKPEFLYHQAKQQAQLLMQIGVWEDEPENFYYCALHHIRTYLKYFLWEMQEKRFYRHICIFLGRLGNTYSSYPWIKKLYFQHKVWGHKGVYVTRQQKYYIQERHLALPVVYLKNSENRPLQERCSFDFLRFCLMYCSLYKSDHKLFYHDFFWISLFPFLCLL